MESFILAVSAVIIILAIKVISLGVNDPEWDRAHEEWKRRHEV